MTMLLRQSIVIHLMAAPILPSVMRNTWRDNPYRKSRNRSNQFLLPFAYSCVLKWFV